jgi:VWFA-related protein
MSIAKILGFCLLSACALSQAPAPLPQAPSLSIEVKVVTALATVRDKHGQFVSNLNKDDFTLQEDGKAQAIRYFSQESDVPLTLGLLVDTSGSERNLIGKEQTASRSFFDQVLREDKDHAFLIHFDHEVELLQDVTPSRQKLQTALDSLAEGDPGGGGGNRGGYPGGGRGRGRGGPGGGGGGTLLYDAVYLASDELMKEQQGRKAVIILTDGDDRGSKETLATAVESAQRADTVIYSILFKDDEPFDFGRGRHGGRGGRRGGYPFQHGGTDGKKVLERLARETGGRMFEVSKKEPLEKIYSEIQEELRNQYSLGYTPASFAPGYHKIQLSTRQKDLKIQTREGYYADR